MASALRFRNGCIPLRPQGVRAPTVPGGSQAEGPGTTQVFWRSTSLVYSDVISGPIPSGKAGLVCSKHSRDRIHSHPMNESNVSGTEQPDECKGAAAYADFCTRFEPLVHRILREEFPNPPREDFVPLLQVGIMKKLWAHRPPDAEPFVRKTAHVASLIHRHSEGLLAVEALAAELEAELRSCFQNEFSHVPFSWEDIQPKFLDKLTLASPSAERAAEFNGFARTVLVNLVIDELRRRGREVLEADLSVQEDKVKTIEDIAEPTAAAPLPETDSVTQALRRLNLDMMRIPFLCPPNPPHQSLAWGYKELLGKGPKKIIKENYADLPLRRLRVTFLQQLPQGRLSMNQWAQVIGPLREQMDLQVGNVFVDATMRKTYAHLLGRICGDTCFRDYTTGEFREKGGIEGSGQAEDELLARNVSDWVEAVQRRFQGGVIRMIYDAH